MTADEILRSIRERREHLAPLVAECAELAEADRKLTEMFGRVRLPVLRVVEDAPYGRKADGSPRKRPAMTAEQQARAQATRARKRRAKRREAKRQARLHVQTVTGPTSREMEDREVAHVTAEPA